MKKEKFIILLSLFLISCGISSVSAVDVAPRISDREIVESLSELKEGQKNLDKRFDDLRLEMNNRFEAMDKRFDDLRLEMNNRFEAMDKRFDDLRSEINSRFDILTWILGLFVTIALIIFGFVILIQWEMHKRLTHVETSLETQKDEMAFLKGLIDKLMPPKGAL